MKAILLILMVLGVSCHQSTNNQNNVEAGDQVLVSGKLRIVDLDKSRITEWSVSDHSLDSDVKSMFIALVGRLEKESPVEVLSEGEKFATATYINFSMSSGRLVYCMPNSFVVKTNAEVKEYSGDALYKAVKRWMEEGKIKVQIRDVPYSDGTVSPPS
ncbi:hypothetical protein OKA05_28305 [Luteolibacter arcticus]|uniref:Uncharacterized protein n=1 Tax=Luteolibacter arcticus TaxID=1581411 RepID=A0ABT3GSI1_9BACT|nr:hypothetical protein [Luteolibacter arcticus]MCW1926487.1 hypothetical protein [Luteolibacter arcticus]